MTICSTAGLAQTAAQSGYAVPAINVVDSFSMRGVVRAAEWMSSPVIIQTSVKTVKAIGAHTLHAMFTELAESTNVPLALHLDHCPDLDMIRHTLRVGWTSVLFDASDRDLATAEREAKDIVAEAHSLGASVEIELENIAGVEDNIGNDIEGSHYALDVIAQFLETTGCDLFAPALGTAHGLYRNRPHLRFDRAADLARFTKIPIVLHGGTGLDPSDFRHFIKNGCSKINLSTTLKRAYLEGLARGISMTQDSNKWDPLAAFEEGTRGVIDDATRYMRLFGSAGTAV